MHAPTPADASPDAHVQRTARAFVVALHGALRAVRLYPIENVAVQKALADLSSSCERVRAQDDHCELRRAGDYLFVNEVRMRLTLDNYAAVANVLSVFADAGIGGFSVLRPTQPRAWVVLLAFLLAPPLDVSEAERLTQLSTRLAQAAITDFEFSAINDEAMSNDDAELDLKERARQTYVRSISVTRDVMTAARLGKSQGLKRVKRAVQGIVDAILGDAASLIGLTTLREFDDYTFVHSVNVCILSVALGRRLGLTKIQMLDLGLAALLHDIGKAKLPLEMLNKRGQLEPHERELLQSHSWQGVLALFELPVGAGRPWRAIRGAYEHHMRIDFSGYPTPIRPRQLSLFSKIIAVADGFDAATTTRVYQESPWTPADVLRGMRDNRRLGLDAVVVKAFINLTGIYPVGTLVVLDSLELALVVVASPEPSAMSRPLVRLLTDGQGNRLADSPMCDLTLAHDNGQFIRTIIRTEDPERFGIQVGDFFA